MTFSPDTLNFSFTRPEPTTVYASAVFVNSGFICKAIVLSSSGVVKPTIWEPRSNRTVQARTR